MNIPGPKQLPNFPEGGVLPHVIVADEAFPQRCDLMKPHSRSRQRLTKEQQIYNYRLSRARRLVECCFGILAQRFRIFCKRIMLFPDNVDTVVKACCVLHNYLRGHKTYEEQAELLNPRGRQPFLHDNGAILALRNRGHHTANEAKAIRDIFTAYFNSPHGSVPWQDRAIL